MHAPNGNFYGIEAKTSSCIEKDWISNIEYKLGKKNDFSTASISFPNNKKIHKDFSGVLLPGGMS